MDGSLSARVREPEWMDRPDLDPALHRQALRGMTRIHAASRALAAVWPSVAAVAAASRGRPVSVLDVACGGGDLAIGLARRARRRGVALAVEGCDLSPTAVAHAQERADSHGLPVRFFTHDVLGEIGLAGRDVVVCALFLHHLDERDAVRVLGDLGRAARARLVVIDLDRSRIGLTLAWIATRVVSRSPIVRVDGARSVRAAFTPAEAARLAAEAGLAPCAIARCWPRRWRLEAVRG